MNNIFSFRRMYLLYRQALIEDKKDLIIYVGGLIGTILLIMAFLFLVNIPGKGKVTRMDMEELIPLFLFMYGGLGVFYNSMAFPKFRNKEKTLSYLMLPASKLEKFTFEFLNKWVLFVAGFPVLFWMLANFVGTMYHMIEPRYVHFTFTYDYLWVEIPKVKYMLSALMILTFSIAFTGASHFQKKVLIKTLFTLALTLAAFFLYGYLLVKGLDVESYRPVEDRITFLRSEEDAIQFATTTAIATNLILLVVSYFKLNEKEV